MAAFLDLSPEHSTLLRRIFKGTLIEKRHTVIEDYTRDPFGGDFLGTPDHPTTPGMSRRNEFYKLAAPPLSLECAEAVLTAWGGPRADISHVIYVSCTGLVAPGIEFLLTHDLGLNRSVQRFGLNFMGCFGAFKGLAMARAFAREDARHRILLVCTELCSLHFDLSGRPESFVPNALFADGSAAVVVGRDPGPDETSLFAIEHQASIALEDSLHEMRWEATDQGLQMVLSAKVPERIEEQIMGFAFDLLKGYGPFDTCDWALHPGGKAILETIESRCDLQPDQTAASWSVLRNYGNMSSATFLYVLQEQLKRPTLRGRSVGMGFGPGLSIEGIVLTRLAS